VAAIGMIGITIAGVLRYVDPDPSKSISWALAGFSDGTVWLIFGAFVFSIGYAKSGLGRRIALQLVRLLGAQDPWAGLRHHAFRSGAGPRHAIHDRP